MTEYFDLENIKKLGLPDEIEDKFKKRVFFEDSKGYCRTGEFIGIARESSGFYYIINTNGILSYIPIWKSLTKM